MLKIVTDVQKLEKELILNISYFFGEIITTDMLDKDDIDFILKIERPRDINTETGRVDSRFGDTCDIYDISNGCKTLIVANHMRLDKSINRSINLNNCGKNALEEFIDKFYDTDLECLLTGTANCYNSFKDDTRCILLNGKEVMLKDLFREIFNTMRGEKNDLL